MPQALITLSENDNRALNVLKAKYACKDKSETIRLLISKFIEDSGDPELRPEFIEKIMRRRQGPFIRVNDFAKQFGVSSRRPPRPQANPSKARKA